MATRFGLSMLMAGLDGIKNKLNPGKAMDKDLYDLPPKELKKIPTVCGSLREALESLDKDRKFLTAGGVFDDDQIDSFIELKMQEVMSQNAGQEKIALAYQRFLAPLGIVARVRTVDDSQYQLRSQSFDYDVIIKSFPSSLSPGLEQINRWSSRTRDRQGSDNFAGVADKDVDKLINNILQARNPDDFTAAVRAHDRLLVNNSYVVPLYHLDAQWIARWKRIGRPTAEPLYGYQLPSWWDERVQ